MYQIHAPIQYDDNAVQLSFPSLHIDLGSVNLGTTGSVGSVCFGVCINLGRVSICNLLLRHQDTTLRRFTIVTIFLVVQIYQRHAGGRIDCDSAFFTNSFFFSSTLFCLYLTIFAFADSASVILYCVTLSPSSLVPPYLHPPKLAVWLF